MQCDIPGHAHHLRYYKINYKISKACGDRFLICVIYKKNYVKRDYKCGVITYVQIKRKTYIYNLVKYSNCINKN